MLVLSVGFFTRSLETLKLVGTSWPALIGYVAALIAFIVYSVKVTRNRHILSKINKVPDDKAFEVLQMELGVPYLKEGLDPKQYLTHKRQQYNLIRFFVVSALIALLSILVWLAFPSTAAKPPSSNPEKPLGSTIAPSQPTRSTEAAPSRPTTPESLPATAASAAAAPQCRFVFFEPWPSNVSYVYFTVAKENVGLDEGDSKRPNILSIKFYDSAEYDFIVTQRDDKGTHASTGYVALTSAVYYQYEPAGGMVRTRRMAAPASDLEAQRFLARHRLTLPDCGKIPPGVAWVTAQAGRVPAPPAENPRPTNTCFQLFVHPLIASDANSKRRAQFTIITGNIEADLADWRRKEATIVSLASIQGPTLKLTVSYNNDPSFPQREMSSGSVSVSGKQYGTMGIDVDRHALVLRAIDATEWQSLLASYGKTAPQCSNLKADAVWE